MRRTMVMIGTVAAVWGGLLAVGTAMGDTADASDCPRHSACAEFRDGTVAVSKPVTSTKPAPTVKSGPPTRGTPTRKPGPSGQPTTTKAAPPTAQCEKGTVWNGRTCA
ncbi:hypothetical protein [Nocardia cyriacigeorgica]|uniref:hypothetical protein n=1 Tax=Nocardia cyriacigeorgica TaxID=135487 RepID=UPI002455ED4F|nr:hypothetical protein [Nocardia cyriacigeorgica]